MKISIYSVQDNPIGRGGMGQVYLASDSQGNMVAIKEMLAQYVTDAHLRSRFHQEVNILNQLEHQSIVKMHASFEERGNLYLVMEYVEGETVEQYVRRRGKLVESEVVRILCEILSALGYAHQKGFVHRDIKPGNIMIRPNGNVCILDFGIAKDMNRSSGGLTVGQLTIGTDGYMSPEQAEGLSIDQRSDIYSLGCVLFYMLTGQHAIQKQQNDYATRMAIIQSKFPTAKDHNPDLSDSIQKVLDKATHKDMRMRFQSCREFELELNNGTVFNNYNDPVDIVTIGKGNCDIIVNHPKVSRHHADVECVHTSNRPYYILRDRSTNGTMVDGVQVHHREIHISNFSSQAMPRILLAGEVALNWSDIDAAFRNKQSGNETVHITVPFQAEEQPQFQHQSQSAPPVQPYQPQSAIWQLIAVFGSLLAGVLLYHIDITWMDYGLYLLFLGALGVSLGIITFCSKITLPDGRKTDKYANKQRTAALIGGILSGFMLLWGLIIVLLFYE